MIAGITDMTELFDVQYKCIINHFRIKKNGKYFYYGNVNKNQGFGSNV